MKNVMLDLETMGTRSTSAIIAIGAVKFDENGLGEGFYKVIDLQSCIDAGLTIDGGTVMWWMGQSDEARAQFDKKRVQQYALIRALGSFATELLEVTSNCQVSKSVKLWGNGADFDNPMLANAYRVCGLSVPWEFWNNRCYRTVKSMNRGVKMERVGTYHNALDDAKSQALHLIDIINQKGLQI